MTLYTWGGETRKEPARTPVKVRRKAKHGKCHQDIVTLYTLSASERVQNTSWEAKATATSMTQPHEEARHAAFIPSTSEVQTWKQIQGTLAWHSFESCQNYLDLFEMQMILSGVRGWCKKSVPVSALCFVCFVCVCFFLTILTKKEIKNFQNSLLTLSHCHCFCRRRHHQSDKTLCAWSKRWVERISPHPLQI